MLRQRDERASGKGPQSRRMRLCKERNAPAGQHCSRPEKAAGRAAVRRRRSRTTMCQWPSCSPCTRESARGHGSIVSKCMQCCSPLRRPQTGEKTQRYVRSWARLCHRHGRHDIHTPLSCRRQQHTGHKHLSATKVAELHDVAVWIQEQVLRLNVPVTHTSFVDVGQRSRYLIHIELGENGRNKPGRSAATGKDVTQSDAEESKAKDASLHQLMHQLMRRPCLAEQFHFGVRLTCSDE